MVNMNMIVNRSDLVGYEADLGDSTAAKNKALSKIVAAWESKQAKNAKRLGGLGLLAVSLAACNSSTDDTTASTPATPVVTTPTVTALSQALTAAADVVTSTFTSADDNITGTPATYGAGDVLVDGSSTDNDTLTITMAAGGAVGPAATVTGIENLIFNNTSISTAAAVDASNVIGAHITVNSIANTLVAMDSATITNVGTNSSVTLGTNIDGSDGNTSTVETANSAANVTVNTGAAIASVDLGTAAAGTTINGGAGTGALTVRMDWANLGASAGANINTITTVNSATTGGVSVLYNSGSGTTITTS
jgi:hypothetical protein